jgi:hypothetical protein
MSFKTNFSPLNKTDMSKINGGVDVPSEPCSSTIVSSCCKWHPVEV